MGNKLLYKWYKKMIEGNPVEPPENTWENIEKELDVDLFNRYRKAVESHSGSPPGEVWEKIENRLDQDLYQWYQGIPEQNEEDSPEWIWDNIQDQLDIDYTWEKISGNLNRFKTKRRQMYLRRAVAAAVLILLLLQIIAPFNRDMHSIRDQKEYTRNQAGSVPPESGKNKALKAGSNAEPKQSVMLAETASGKNGKGNTAPDKKNEEHPSLSPQEDRALLAQNVGMQNTRLKTRQVKLDVRSEVAAIQEMQDQTTGSSPVESANAGIKMQYYLGITGEVGNSWLLNQKTLYSIRSSPYSAAPPNTGKSFGIVGGIGVNDRLSFQAEGLFQNGNGQSYKEYVNGKVNSSYIFLNYASVDLLARYEIVKSSFSLPVSHHLVMGIYGSYLKNAYQEVNGITENLNPLYKDYDLGFVVGYEFDTRISGQYTVSTGFRLDPGLVNIYKGMSTLPAFLNKTYSSSLNLSITLKYQPAEK